jgi:hypothetical protein
MNTNPAADNTSNDTNTTDNTAANAAPDAAAAPGAAATDTNTETPKSESKEQEKPAEELKKEAAAQPEAKLSWWGVTWRATTWLLAFMAALVAVVFGMHYAIAYIDNTGLTEMVKNIMGYVVTFIGFIAASFVGTRCAEEAYNAFKRGPEAEATPEPAAA